MPPRFKQRPATLRGWFPDGRVIDQVGRVVPCYDELTWDVGEETVCGEIEALEDLRNGRPYPIEFAAEDFFCTCGTKELLCVHIRAVLLYETLEGTAAPALRPAAPPPNWSWLLSAGCPAPPASPPGPDQRHEGWILYAIEHDTRRGARIQRSLVRLGRRDGRRLQPRPLPRNWADAEQQVRGLSGADRRLDRLCRDLETLAGNWLVRPGERLCGLVHELLAELFGLLAGAREVQLDGEPVTVRPEPLQLGLRAGDGEAGGLLLGVDPPVERVFELCGHPVALLAEGKLALLAEGTAPDLLKSFKTRLPIPAAEVAPFLQRVLHEALPVRLEATAIDARRIEAEPIGRVLLAEEQDSLLVRQVCAYRQAGRIVAEVGPDDSRPALPALMADDSVGLLARDLEREAAIRDELHALVGTPLPLRLEGEQALDFLADELPALRERCEVFGDAALALYRPPCEAGVQVRVSSGIDWLDLQIEFSADGRSISRAAVLRAMREGKRYVRLDDGRSARLPQSWLQRHGAALDELEALRGRDGRLAGHAAPLALELLEEAEGDPGAWIERARRLANFSGIPQREPPAELTGVLRDYQRQGFRWLAFLRDAGLGGCLADDMGLGKTLQALALLAETHREAGPPSLVVAPTSVIHNWAREAAHFTPSLQVSVWHGAGRPTLEQARAADLVVTSYGLLRLEVEALAAVEWSHLVLDEAQQAKNPQSRVARAARVLQARQRLALTGTPLENNLLELWSLFQFLMPGFFGSQAEFTRRHAAPGDAAIERLRARIRPFVLRRHKQEVAAELPPLQEVVLDCELDPRQREVYESLRKQYRESVLEQVEQHGIEHSTFQILEALTRLRQACCDVRLLPDEEGREEIRSTKLELLLDCLEQAAAEGHRSLVFSQWTSLLRLVVPRLRAAGLDHLYLDGATTRRQALVDRWNDPAGPPVFLISLKAGGIGLNLTGADHVFHLDPWWNPAAERQATDRAHRIGQTRPVIAYKLVARDTVEDKVLALQARKRALFEAAFETGRLEVDRLSRDDLEQVFGPPARPPRRRARTGASPPAGEEWPAALQATLDQCGRLTNADVRAAFGLAALAARQWLERQIAAGRLERRGHARAAHYVRGGGSRA